MKCTIFYCDLCNTNMGEGNRDRPSISLHDKDNRIQEYNDLCSACFLAVEKFIDTLGRAIK